jgi:hypothetical protein
MRPAHGTQTHIILQSGKLVLTSVLTAGAAASILKQRDRQWRAVRRLSLIKPTFLPNKNPQEFWELAKLDYAVRASD